MLRRIEQLLTVLGGGWGLLVMAWATTLMEPPSVLWLVVVIVIAATPYVLALSTLVPGGGLGGRAARLAGATVLSLALAVVTGFSIGVLFLPATAALGAATGLALAARVRGEEAAGA